MGLQIVILAAGRGKRMHSTHPKVLHSLAGQPLLEHVIRTSLQLSPDIPPIIVHGHQGQRLYDALSHYDVKWIEQQEQRGTGHALLQALPLMAEDDQVLVLYGDVPLIAAETLNQLMKTTPSHGLGLLTAYLNNPKGYGRIKRQVSGKIIGIVEEKDATEEERQGKEVNSGIYFLPARYLKKWLPTLKNQNAQQEYYLTDIISFAVQENIPIHAVHPLVPEEILGVNDRLQLMALERFYQQKQAEKWMQQGVTIADSARFDVRGDVQIGRDVFIDINVILEGRVEVGDDCVIGPNVILRNTKLSHHVEVKANSVIDGAEIGAHAIIGPFARLRPGTILAEDAHIGNFVEIKNSQIGQKTKINHLSYVGDSQVGKAVNVGAGTITCNYDGVNKHQTVIGDRVQIGSDSTLVAPIVIHDDVYIAAATTLRSDVPKGVLAYNPRQEKYQEGWVKKKSEKAKKA